MGLDVRAASQECSWTHASFGLHGLIFWDLSMVLPIIAEKKDRASAESPLHQEAGVRGLGFSGVFSRDLIWKHKYQPFE